MRPTRITAGATVAIAGAAAFPAAAAPAPPTAAPVKVVMSDYAFALSKKAVPLGKVSFGVVNVGEVVHDFRIAGKKTPIYATGQFGALTVVFRQAGKYKFICTVPGHVAAGMKGVLTVR